MNYKNKTKAQLIDKIEELEEQIENMTPKGDQEEALDLVSQLIEVNKRKDFSALAQREAEEIIEQIKELSL